MIRRFGEIILRLNTSSPIRCDSDLHNMLKAKNNSNHSYYCFKTGPLIIFVPNISLHLLIYNRLVDHLHNLLRKIERVKKNHTSQTTMATRLYQVGPVNVQNFQNAKSHECRAKKSSFRQNISIAIISV